MNNLEVALVKRLCPVCCKEMDGEIIINSTLTPKYANQVKEMHGKVIGYSDTLCDDCKSAIGEGVYFISIDEEKSNEDNPYRTGKIIGITNEAFERMFNTKRNDFFFINDSLFDELFKQ